MPTDGFFNLLIGGENSVNYINDTHCREEDGL
jgi:hypothetical protein